MCVCVCVFGKPTDQKSAFKNLFGVDTLIVGVCRSLSLRIAMNVICTGTYSSG